MPSVIEHRIDRGSPLWGMSDADMRAAGGLAGGKAGGRVGWLAVLLLGSASACKQMLQILALCHTLALRCSKAMDAAL